MAFNLNNLLKLNGFFKMRVGEIGSREKEWERMERNGEMGWIGEMEWIWEWEV